jgi:uncharacterized glyoxalase superfamily protein PhnB
VALTSPAEQSASSESAKAPPQLLSIAPYFFVRDLQKSAAYYSDQLGFVHGRFWGDPPNFCVTRREGLTVMLSSTEDPTKVRPNSKDGEAWDAYVSITDSESLFQEFKRRGAEIVYEPSVTFYSHREFAVRDPDGYILAFGQDLDPKG